MKWIACALLLSACGGSRVRPREVQATASVQPRRWMRVPEEAVVYPPSTWTTYLQHGREIRVQDGHGATCVFVGRDRGVLQENGSVRWSRTPLSERVQSVHVVPEGVLIVSEDGVVTSARDCLQDSVFRAELGTLRSMHSEFRVQGELYASVPGRPRSLTRFAYGKPGKELDYPEPMGILALGAASKNEIELLLEGGVRLRSEDAGEHWTRMTPTPWIPTKYAFHEGRLMLVDTQQSTMYPVLEHGVLEAPEPTPPPPDRVAARIVPLEHSEPASELYPEMFRLLPRDLHGLHWEWRGSAGASALVGVESLTGRVKDTLRVSEYIVPSFSTWERGVVVQHGNDLFVRDLDARLTRSTVADPERGAVLSSDLQHLYWRGACSTTEIDSGMLEKNLVPSLEESDIKLCHWSSDAFFVETIPGASTLPSLAVGDSFGVMNLNDAKLVVHDRRDPSKVLAELSAPSVNLELQGLMGVTADGMYWSLAQQDPASNTLPVLETYAQSHGARSVKTWPEDLVHTVIERWSWTLHPGDSRNAMLLSVGAERRSVWITNDGFASWRSLDLAGAVSSAVTDGRSVCNAEGCLFLPSRLWLSFSATQQDLPPPSPPLRPLQLPVDADALKPDNRATVLPLLTMRCASPTYNGATPRRDARLIRATDNGWTRGLADGRPDAPGSNSFSWGGVDSQGVYGPLQGTMLLDPSQVVTGFDVTRDGVLVMSCNEVECALKLEGLKSRTLLTMTPRDEWVQSWYGPRVWVDELLVAEPTLDTVRWIDSAAGTAGIRSIPLLRGDDPFTTRAAKVADVTPENEPPEPIAGYHLRPGRTDVLVASRALGTERWMLVPLDPSLPVETLARPDLAHTGLCTRAPVAGAVHTYLKTRKQPNGERFMVMLEEQSGERCIRRVTSAMQQFEGVPMERRYYVVRNGHLEQEIRTQSEQLLGTMRCEMLFSMEE